MGAAENYGYQTCSPRQKEKLEAPGWMRSVFRCQRIKCVHVGRCARPASDALLSVVEGRNGKMPVQLGYESVALEWIKDQPDVAGNQSLLRRRLWIGHIQWTLRSVMG
jgi:hypothetical protein